MSSGMTPSLARFLNLIDHMRVHGGKDRPAPHKPLLLMWALERAAQYPKSAPLFPYLAVHEPMIELLALAGKQSNPRPWYPFVRLRQDGFWTISPEPALNDAGDVRSAAQLKGLAAGLIPEFHVIACDRDNASRLETAAAVRWLDDSIRDRVLEAIREFPWGPDGAARL